MILFFIDIFIFIFDSSSIKQLHVENVNYFDFDYK